MNTTLEEISTVPDIPPTYLRYFFGSKNRKIVADIKRHADTTCHMKVSEAYITNSLNKFNKGIVYYKGQTVKGFAVWKEHVTEPRNTLKDATYIHSEKFIDLLLICSARPESGNNSKNRKTNDRIGSRLLYDIERYALENSCIYITLQPASPDLIDFYKKFGYTVDLPNPLIRRPLTMVKPIKPLTITKTKTTRRRRHSAEPLRGSIEYYNSILHPVLQNSDSYKLLDEYFKRDSV